MSEGEAETNGDSGYPSKGDRLARTRQRDRRGRHCHFRVGISFTRSSSMS